ncbi:hypothetical protein GY654_02285 [Vibrio parahaemolyticus]|nr:hypothetical protein [Vibrio parahaemolyticus]
MKILYLHDYPFRVEPNGGIGFEVGMPISYFDRFINNGFSVDILSRINSTLDGNFIKKEDIKISKFSSRSYFVVFFKMFSLFLKKENMT